MECNIYFNTPAGQRVRYCVCNSKLDSSRNTLRKRARREITTVRTIGSRSLFKVPIILALASLDALPVVVLLLPLLLRFCGWSLGAPNAVKTNYKDYSYFHNKQIEYSNLNWSST